MFPQVINITKWVKYEITCLNPWGGSNWPTELNAVGISEAIFHFCVLGSYGKNLLLEALSLYLGLSAMSTTDLKGKEVNDQHSSPLQAGDIICDVYVKVYPDF